MELKNLKSKRPWGRATSDTAFLNRGAVELSNIATYDETRPMVKLVSQADFLREYYPTSHLINDPNYYPDIYREEIVGEVDPDTGAETGKTTRRLYVEHVPRYSFAFQQIILIKRLAHLCGNDIQFDLNTSDPTETQQKDITKFREGWMEKDMETAFFKLMEAVGATADGAIAVFMDKDKKFSWKCLSFKNGDILYPHYDEYGELSVFGRSYVNYDTEDGQYWEYMEVWDNKNIYRFRQAKNEDTASSFTIGGYKLDGYVFLGSNPHGFNQVPVVYERDDDGACWSAAQDSIDGYELAFSQMAHNNQAFGEPILYLQGENIEVGNGLNGTIKTLTMGTEDKAGYLQSQSASESYKRQLEINYKMIYEQSFTVVPPELKSGDLPAAALKILYSPAYEKAMSDAQKFQDCLNNLVDLFAYGYGLELGGGYSTTFVELPLKSWIKPYIHVNESAMVNDLVAAVGSGFCSRETASERIQFYTTPGEWNRITKEKKELEKSDLLYNISLNKANQQNGDDKQVNGSDQENQKDNNPKEQ